MKFTVKDALGLKSLKDAKLVAGHEGLNNSIRFISVMEVPDISDWISGYEMLLTTAYVYRNSDKEWIKLIKDLKDKKLSALAIKVNRYISHIPEKVKALGNELHIPIIELPSNAKFDLIINDVMRALVNEDYVLIKKAEKIHRNFTQIILSGGELNDIVRTLSDITDSTVIVKDEDNNILAEYIIDNDMEGLNMEKVGQEERAIKLYNKTDAYIKMISINGSFEPDDIMAMERAIDAIAIVLLQKRGEEAIERKYRNDFLNDVIKGEFKLKSTLIERAGFFNLDFENHYLFFLLDIDSLDIIFSEKHKESKFQTHIILSELFNTVFNSFFSKSEKSIIWNAGKNIFMLYPIKEEEINDSRYIKDISMQVSNNIKAKVDKHIKEFTISVGMGRFYENILDINKSFEEAKEALRIGKIIWGDNKVYHYDDIGTYNLLMKSGSKDDLREFVNQKLGKLIDYDKKRNTELMLTLKEILENDGNMKMTSEKMFLHSKTIAYRRDQIEDILDISLNNMEEKFSIYMALKIKEIIDY